MECEVSSRDSVRPNVLTYGSQVEELPEEELERLGGVLGASTRNTSKVKIIWGRLRKIILIRRFVEYSMEVYFKESKHGGVWSAYDSFIDFVR